MNSKSYLLFLIVSFIVSVVFTYYYFLYTNEYEAGSSVKIANYQADKVFQTRIFITTLANLLLPLLPVIKNCFQWIVPYPIDFQVLLQIINVIFTFLLIISLPILLQLFDYKGNYWNALIIFIPISWNYIVINGYVDGAGLFYCYDIPSLTFFSLGLIFFLKNKWLYYYPIFIFACLNRESACFISLAGALMTSNFKTYKYNIFFMENKNIFFHVFIQAFIWCTLRIILSLAFKDNPGEFFEEPHSMINFFKTMVTGNSHWAMENPYWFLTLFSGLWLIPLINYKHLNSACNRLIVVGIIYLIVLFFRSNMMETRVYNELNVIITVCAIISLKSKDTFKIIK